MQEPGGRLAWVQEGQAVEEGSQAIEAVLLGRSVVDAAALIVKCGSKQIWHKGRRNGACHVELCQGLAKL